MPISIREFNKKDKEVFIAMAQEFYSSDFVCHSIPKKYIEKTFDTCVAKSPYAKGFILEYNGIAAGYALLSFTYSMEAGGFVVLLEDLYVCAEFRGKGIIGKFFEYLKKEYDKKTARYRLEVTKSNRHAIEIYKHYRFTEMEYLCMCRELN